MPLPAGSYQGIPILEGEFSHRAGFEPGRGWVRVLLSDLQGAGPGERGGLPKSPYLAQIKDFFLRSTVKDNGAAEIKKTFDASFEKEGIGGNTGTRTATSPPKPGFNRLAGPYGDLILNTSDGDGLQATKVTLRNIFWTEAVIEDIDQKDGSVAIVRIELADERITWGMGGYVCGDYNLTLNKLSDNIWTTAIQWDPTVAKPTNTKNLTKALIDNDEYRPILDPRTILKIRPSPPPGQTGDVSNLGGSTPWTLVQLVIDFAQQLPGPPDIEIVSERIFAKIPYNLRYGPAKLAKEALDDLFRRYDLVLCPDYVSSKFWIYDRVQSPRPGDPKNTDEKSIPKEFRTEKWIDESSVFLDQRPLSVEIVGERIMDEILCPYWINVIKDPGYVVKQNGLLGRQGQWIDVDTFCNEYKIDKQKALRALLANWDKDQSSIFEKIVPKNIPSQEGMVEGTDDNDDMRKQILNALHAHFFKSFMASGSYRMFLPMHLERAEGSTHALNMGNMCLTRGARFFADEWIPSKSRTIGIDALFRNRSLPSIDMGDIASIDEKDGVITFREPKGQIAYAPDFPLAASQSQTERIREVARMYHKDADKLSKKIQEVMDGIIFRVGRQGRTFEDSTYSIRQEMLNFMKSKAVFVEGEALKHSYDFKSFKLVSEKLAPAKSEMVKVKDQQMEIEAVNLSECTLVEPRIVGIWAWERNYGRSDDWYRYRFGPYAEAAAYPIKIAGLRQFISCTGATNKRAMDILAQNQAEEYLSKAEAPIGGGQYELIGFWPITLSGTKTEVVFKMSIGQSPEATTIVNVNRFLHGIEGRPPAVTTQSAHLKPVVMGGRGE